MFWFHGQRCGKGTPGDKVCSLLSILWVVVLFEYLFFGIVAKCSFGIIVSRLSELGFMVAVNALFVCTYMLTRGFGRPEYEYLTITLPEDIRQRRILQPFDTPDNDIEKASATIGEKGKAQSPNTNDGSVDSNQEDGDARKVKMDGK